MIKKAVAVYSENQRKPVNSLYVYNV